MGVAVLWNDVPAEVVPPSIFVCTIGVWLLPVVDDVLKATLDFRRAEVVQQCS